MILNHICPKKKLGAVGEMQPSPLQKIKRSLAPLSLHLITKDDLPIFSAPLPFPASPLMSQVTECGLIYTHGGRRSIAFRLTLTSPTIPPPPPPTTHSHRFYPDVWFSHSFIFTFCQSISPFFFLSLSTNYALALFSPREVKRIIFLCFPWLVNTYFTSTQNRLSWKGKNQAGFIKTSVTPRQDKQVQVYEKPIVKGKRSYFKVTLTSSGS